MSLQHFLHKKKIRKRIDSEASLFTRQSERRTAFVLFCQRTFSRRNATDADTGDKETTHFDSPSSTKEKKKNKKKKEKKQWKKTARMKEHLHTQFLPARTTLSRTLVHVNCTATLQARCSLSRFFFSPLAHCHTLKRQENSGKHTSSAENTTAYRCPPLAASERERRRERQVTPRVNEK